MSTFFFSNITAEYVDHMGDDLRPVNAARISFNSESQDMTDKDKKLIKYLADHQHMTPFEHQVLTVIIECPLYVRSQIHRHRTFAYNEVSRRYTSEDLSFYIPPIDDIRKQSKSNKQGSEGPVDAYEAEALQGSMITICESALNSYNELLGKGVAREQARGILPQNLSTRFYMTGNLRNWAHFLKLRLDGHAQKEVRMVAEQVAKIIQDKWPESYKALMEVKHG